ncbi:MAG: hypothetical protein AAGH99_12960 [Planctomycetota bacterium]
MADSIFRILSSFLAFAGLIWGVLCLPFFVINPSNALMFFGPGYLVTAGYIWRSVWPPSTNERKILWTLSGIVQGAWLVLTFETADSFWSSWNGGNLTTKIVLSWWVIALAVSVAGLIADQKTKKIL